MRYIIPVATALALAPVFAPVFAPTPAVAEGASILVQSTTSTANSGLYDHILPMFEADTGIAVHVVAVGTGQAIRNAQNCDADVLLVHAKAAEDVFVAAGYGLERFDLMYNDFVLVGPAADPAQIASSADAPDAFDRIAHAGAIFTSRGDDSGTHKKEMTLWQGTGLNPVAASGDWYRETGSGMGATLNVAIGMGAYAMTDRATWISFQNKGAHRILFEGDAALFNQYGVIAVNPAHCPQVNADGADAFVKWLVSATGQDAIAQYSRDGQQLFFPNAGEMADPA